MPLLLPAKRHRHSSFGGDEILEAAVRHAFHHLDAAQTLERWDVTRIDPDITP